LNFSTLFEFLASMGTLLQVVEHFRGDQFYDEDVQQRQYENALRRLADARRLIDKKINQLKAIAELAALLAGFSVVCLSQSNLPQSMEYGLVSPTVWMFGGLTVIVTTLSLLSAVFCSLILVAISHFNDHESVQPGGVSFQHFWEARCEKDWKFAFRCFIYGVTAFLMDLCFIGWVQFQQSNVACWVCTSVAGTVLLVWLFWLMPTWASHKSSINHYNHQPSPLAPSDEKSQAIHSSHTSISPKIHISDDNEQKWA